MSGLMPGQAIACTDSIMFFPLFLLAGRTWL